ncbi:ABC transporter permease [Pseudodonghicola flavimaris]|uniref:ABC transporter permease n=1 Tax=Pseudodonghicola flavimaris TaxID=3050036 RepID=A0ABT7F559_9RHOB|nr:ABC transporter permease [Pseudodonghicola flavimaris]MDK3019750.1 ABC transporter permease [Pseudodonghicola flavimaris]
MKNILKNTSLAIGLALLALILVIAVFAHVFYPVSPWQSAATPLLEPFSQSGLPLGSDMLGRDVAAGIAYGARVSLTVGVVSTIISVTLGVTIGAVAGFYGGVLDNLLMRFTELFQTVPQFAMAVVFVAIFSPSLVTIVLAISLVSWPPVARLVRGEVMSLKSREFVKAGIVLGESESGLIFRHILPNAVSPIVVMASLMVATAILTESALSFLGLGDRNMISWGYMIGASRTMLRDAWWLSVFPGLAIVVTVVAVNLIGEGFEKALNPQAHGERKA